MPTLPSFYFSFSDGSSTLEYALVSMKTTLDEGSWSRNLNAYYDTSANTLTVKTQVGFAIRNGDIYECIIDEMVLDLGELTLSNLYPSVTFSNDGLYVVGGDESTIVGRLDKGETNVDFNLNSSTGGYYDVSVALSQECTFVDLSRTTSNEFTIDITTCELRINQTAF